MRVNASGRVGFNPYNRNHRVFPRKNSRRHAVNQLPGDTLLKRIEVEKVVTFSHWLLSCFHEQFRGTKR
jgi:hypothetical protein